MLKRWWMSALLLAVAGVPAARGGDAAAPESPPGRPKIKVMIGDNNREVLIEMSEYWLGLQCSAANDALRAQLGLPEKQGIVVEHVVPDSPAAKAGLKPHDVLLKANDKPLEKVADLIEVVNKVKDGKLSLELLRGGKKETLTATPAKRPGGAAGGWAGAPDAGDLKPIEKWLQQMKPGEGHTLQFRFLHPGMILPPGEALPPPVRLPDNLSVTITREGSQPAKITVKEGDQKWEITEKELDKLPEKIRPYVAHMLAGPLGPNVMWGPGTFNVPVPAPGEARPMVREVRPAAPPDMEPRLQELNRQVEQLRKSIDELRGTNRDKTPGRETPEKKKEKKPESAGGGDRI